MRINVTGLVDSLIKDPKVNRNRNDYVYMSGWGGGHELAHQYRFDKREAAKLTAKLEGMSPMVADLALRELAKRNVSQQAVGGVSLTEAAAASLNKLASRLGSEATFTSKTTRPIHPVG